MSSLVRILPEVAQALAAHHAVVALESSAFAQGLPIPTNRHAAQRMVRAIEDNDAVAAITGVVQGVPTVGLQPEELGRFLKQDSVRKVSARDLPASIAEAADGATTVAASLCLARLAGITVFATGGIGGVHRGRPRSTTSAVDESADLFELAHSPMIVVCGGAKAILDLPATWERLETLGIPVVGYRTGQLPGFFTSETGIELTTRADRVEEVVSLYRAHVGLGRSQALLVVQPPPAHYALSPELVEDAVSEAADQAERDCVRGAAMTPYLLAQVTRLTEGRSLETNVALLEGNAKLAAEIAAQLTAAD